MTDLNHRRNNRKPVNQRHPERAYHNGYAWPNNKQHPPGLHMETIEGQERPCVRSQRIGATDFLDKSMHGWGRLSLLADRHVGAGIGNDYTNSHRGMAKAVRGAKKFVRTRIRFHEKQAVDRLRREALKDPQ